MKPEDYLTQAVQHFTTGHYDQSAAAAQIAAAAATIHATSPARQPIHLGDHAPAPKEWCGTCDHPSSRRIGGRACHRCNASAIRVRACRWCGEFLEKRQPPQEPEGVNAWLDSSYRRDCAASPDPALPLPAPEPLEEDHSPEHKWDIFLSAWQAHLEGRVVTSEYLLSHPEIGGILRTRRYDEPPHPKELDLWLAGRQQEPTENVAIEQAEGPLPDTLYWRVPAKQRWDARELMESLTRRIESGNSDKAEGGS
ncbi:hypothetical protein [Streptomyces sp. NPDC048611]|uniref:hypothetical protein n=1 Tax=Streptomyces sp. NPDC048611 TaxID=3155635 RepID=UPI003414952B